MYVEVLSQGDAEAEVVIDMAEGYHNRKHAKNQTHERESFLLGAWSQLSVKGSSDCHVVDA